MDKRLLFIDGLRGVAALMVVAVHLSDAGTTSSAHSFGNEFFAFGRHGVSIFFVISGFIIAYSLRRTPADFASSARFFARRMVRLAIPYWFVVAVTQCCDRPAVTSSSLLAHSVYLQGLLGFGQMTAIFWTLCIEVQFYLAFLLLRLVAARLRLDIGLVAVPLFAASLLTVSEVMGFEHPAFTFNSVTWLVPFFASFYLGILAFGIYSNPSRLRIGLFGLACSAAIVRLVVHFDEWLLVSVVTSALLVAASFGDRMQTWLSDPVSQFFGRISYSLYLWHLFVIGFVVFRVDSRFATLVASVAVAAMMYWLVERPSLILSRAVKSGRWRPGTFASPTAPAR